MYVCLCKAVSDRTILEAVDHGARSVEEVGRRTEAGTVCGGCLATIEALLEESLAARPAGSGAAGPPMKAPEARTGPGHRRYSPGGRYVLAREEA